MLERWEEATRRSAEAAAAAVRAQLEPFLEILRQKLAACETKHGLNEQKKEL